MLNKRNWLTIYARKLYNYRKSEHLISQMPAFLSTNPSLLKLQGLASRSARLFAVVWLSCLACSLFPHKIRLNKPGRQADDYARVMLLRLHLPEGRGYRPKSIATSLYRQLFKRYSTNLLVYGIIVAITFMPLAADSANIGTDMQQFWSNMGGISNTTPGGAYNGQSAGYYSAGNLYARNRVQNKNFVSLQLPSYRAGCGGIDMFAGSFSFINSQNLTSLMNSISSNATAFAFKLALDTLSPQIGQQIAELQKIIQEMNAFQTNSCEQAAALVGGVWPASDQASKSICAAIGNHRGLFTDYAAAQNNCGTGGQRASTLANDGDEYHNVKIENTNIAWKAIKDSNLFGSGTSFDTDMAQLFMSLSGTVIIRAGDTDDEPAQFQYIDSKVATNEVISALLDGGTINVIQCDETDKCLNPTVDGNSHTLSADNAFQARVQAMLTDIAARISAENDGAASPLTAQELGFLNMTSVPIYKVLNVYSAYSGASSYFELSTYGEIIASDILFEYLRKVMKDIQSATSRLNIGDSKELAEFKTGLEAAKKDLANREAKTHKTLDTLLSLVQRTSYIENLLAGQLSASASDSLKWSKSFK